jgi:hypothetical protein
VVLVFQPMVGNDFGVRVDSTDTFVISFCHT